MQLIIDTTSMESKAHQLGAMADDIIAACSAGLKDGVKFVASQIIKDELTGQAVKKRSGNLARAVDGWMESDLEGVIGVADNSAADSYKWILGEETKTIRPKKSKFLAIPIADGLTPSGVAKYSSPRDVEDGFFFTSNGQLFFGRHKGKTTKSKIELLFVFKKSVTIEGTGALARGASNNIGMVTDSINRKLEGVTDGN